MPRSSTQTRRAQPYCRSILARNICSVVQSAMLPANTSWASGRPSGVTTKAIAISPKYST